MKTIKQPAEAEYLEKKSRFISYLNSARSENEARMFVNKITSEHPDATHIVYAYKLIENSTLKAKCSDAGEPKNTAGRPVLELLNKIDMINVIVVTARYFGGVKLGAPGLTRAYAKSAKLAIEKTELCEFVKKIPARMEFDYPLTNNVLKQISSLKNCEITDRQFGEKVVFVIFGAEDEIRELDSTFKNFGIKLVY